MGYRRPHEFARRERMEKQEREMREANRGKVQGRKRLLAAGTKAEAQG